MKILFLTQVLPYPLDAGPKTRAYYTLRHLAQDHEVTLVSFVRSTDTAEAVRHLEQFCAAVHTVPMLRSRPRDAVQLALSLLLRRPFIIQRDQAPAMARTISRCMADGGYAAIHADQLWMASYALAARRSRAGAHPPAIVLDQHNAVYRIPERMAAAERNPLVRAVMKLEARKMARYEVATCPQFDRVVWVIEGDHEAVAAKSEGGWMRIPCSAIIPICGDPEATRPVARKAGARRVVFLSGLHYPPNAQAALWFAEHVFSEVLRRAPEAVYTVIGKDPPRARLAAAVPAHSLDVTGYVRDLQPYLEETAAFVVPLLAGGGMRVKIIDAWQWGLPIVSTTIGAEGIEIMPGENILIADAADAFARATAELVNDSTMQARLARAGRQWVEQRYGWRTRYRQWDEVYANLEPSTLSLEPSLIVV